MSPDDTSELSDHDIEQLWRRISDEVRAPRRMRRGRLVALGATAACLLTGGTVLAAPAIQDVLTRNDDTPVATQIESLTEPAKPSGSEGSIRLLEARMPPTPVTATSARSISSPRVLNSRGDVTVVGAAVSEDEVCYVTERNGRGTGAVCSSGLNEAGLTYSAGTDFMDSGNVYAVVGLYADDITRITIETVAGPVDADMDNNAFIWTSSVRATGIVVTGERGATRQIPLEMPETHPGK